MRGTCQQLFRFASIAFCLILAACSGGGGGDSSGVNTDGLSLSTNVLTFSAPNTNSTPPSQIITATVAGVTSGALYIKIVSTGPAVASITNITVTGSTTGQGTINPAPANILGPGVHTSTITVYACTTDPDCSSGQLAGSPQIVNVTYTVNGVAASVSSLQYSVGNIPISGGSERQFTFNAYPYQNWNAGTDVPWLSVLPASGNTGSASQVTASLLQVEVDGMPNGAYTGTVTLTLSSGTIVTIPVALTVARTQVNYVAPYVAISNSSGEVIIRGENFTQVTVQDVTFGGVSATAFTVVSDTEIHATHPPLSAGTYAVKLQNNLGIDRSLANLVAVTPRSYSAGTLQYPQTPHQPLALEYDAEREALLVAVSYFDGNNFNTASRQGNRILRYQFVNGAIDSISMKEIPLLQDLALSPDGRQVIAITDNAVIHLDPVNLSEMRRTNASLSSSYYLKDIVVTNDGNALITTGLSGSGGTPTYLYPLSQSLFQNTFQPCNYFATPAVSADGSLAVFIQGGLSPVPPLCSYESSSGSFAVLPINANQTQCMNSAMGTCRTPSLDKSANHISVIDVLYTASIYARNFTLLGRLPGMFGVVTLSPDGTRAYAYESNGILRTFDMTANTVNGQFQEIGSGTMLAGNPGSAVVTYPPSPYTIVKITVSPDGGTLFLAGSNQLVIQPAP
jgi:hypothetical protein